MGLGRLELIIALTREERKKGDCVGSIVGRTEEVCDVKGGYLFQGGSLDCLDCLDAADVDDSGELDISDPIRLLGYLFQGGEPPAPPLAVPGFDPTADELDCARGI